MTVIHTVNTMVDPNSLVGLKEFRARLSWFYQLVEKPVDLVELINRLPRGAAAFKLQTCPTSGAGEQRVIFQFAQPWFDLMAALRALDRDGDFVARSGHSQFSVVGWHHDGERVAVG